MSLFSNILTICNITFASLICAKNLFQSHSPELAPDTIHAMSINSTVAGIIFCQFTTCLIFSNLWSSTFTIHIFGSIVQNGKFCASAE
jgi:hypothetical protein